MKIAVFVPFGSQSQESGLIYLLANFLRVNFPEVVQLRCNGAFSLCDRDAESSWTRSIQSCFGCMSDQKALSAWSGMPVQDISTYLKADDVNETKKWVHALRDEELLTATYGEEPVYKIVSESFAHRFGMQPDLNNKQHGQYLRRLLLAGVRMSLTAKRYHLSFSPDITLVAGGRDYC